MDVYLTRFYDQDLQLLMSLRQNYEKGDGAKLNRTTAESSTVVRQHSSEVPPHTHQGHLGHVR